MQSGNDDRQLREALTFRGQCFPARNVVTSEATPREHRASEHGASTPSFTESENDIRRKFCAIH